MHFWLKKFAPIHAFIGGSLLGIFNFIYLERTKLGRFDTDSLILFFIFWMLLFITKAVEDKEKSYFWIVVSAVVFNIFMWWYYQTTFSVVFTLSLILGLLYNKESFRDIFYKVSLFVLLIGTTPFLDFLGNRIFNYINGYIFKEQSQIIPFSIASTISELQPVSIDTFISFTTANLFSVIIGFVGLILLFYKNFRYMLIALPIIIIGLSTFKAGNRYIIYIAPFLGIGIGYFLYYLTIVIKEKSNIFNSVNQKFLYIISILLTLLLSFPNNAFDVKAQPLVSSKTWKDLNILKSKLEKNAYIWTWWDYGYILQYTLNRGTFVDNGNFNDLKLYFYAHSLMLKDENKARNIIAFTTNNLQKDYGSNIKSIKDTLYLKDIAYSYDKSLNNPVYLVFFGNMLGFYPIFNLGNFGNNEKIANNPIRFFKKCRDNQTFYYCDFFTVEKGSYKITWKNDYPKNNPNFKEVILSKKDRTLEVVSRYESSDKDIVLEILDTDKGMFFFIIDKNFKESMFNRMFILRDNSMKNFKVVFDNFPLMVVYKVYNIINN